MAGELLCRVANGEKIGDETPTLDQRIHADKEACQYILAKRKAVEHSGELKGPLVEIKDYSGRK